ncbi:MAG: radical SAM protein [Firmicutes bacterium]|nr:radical SAM protein [Bacillota bacterium]
MVEQMKESRKKKLNILISNQCFLKCDGCYNRFKSKELKLDELKEFLQFVKSNEINNLTLSGGDPLTRDDIAEILSFLMKLDFKITLDTVGTTFISDAEISQHKLQKIKNIELFKKLDMLGIPLDGSDDKTISSFRGGRENIFDEQMRILRELDKNEIGFCVNTIYHNKNKSDMSNIHNMIKDFRNLKKWQIFQFMPIGYSGKKNAGKFIVTTNDLLDLDRELKSLKSKSNFDIVLKTAKERSFNYMFIASDGEAYKTDISDSKEVFGDVNKKETWNNIINNL